MPFAYLHDSPPTADAATPGLPTTCLTSSLDPTLPRGGEGWTQYTARLGAHGLATRYEKTATSYEAAATLASFPI